ncbi:uncharacterized protein [Centruroides vittatus]|uniref:uncharacterized protein n=1 Tax=Centruroides vittatus TaxID=120091 RepID=UPI0035101888
MASPACLYRNYRKLAVKIVKIDSRLKFLKECRVRRVYPMSIFRIKLPDECMSMRERVRKLCLNSSIKRVKNMKYRTIKEIVELEENIFEKNPDMLASINLRVVGLTDRITISLRKKYRNKLLWITKKQPSKTTSTLKPTPYILWDQIQLPQCVERILEKGPNYVPDSNKNWRGVVAEIERGIVGMCEVDKDYYRWKTVFKTEKCCRRQGKELCINQAKKWLNANDIVVTRADKSKHLVLMKKQRYNEALDEYIRKTECEEVDRTVVERIDRKLRRLEKSPIASLFPFLKGAHITCPGVPRLFGFAKIHKSGKEVRPVVEKCKGPTYILEKRMHRHLTPLIEDYQFVTKDAFSLVKNLHDISLMDKEIGTVMDFESMFPSINLTSCFEELMNLLCELHPKAYEHKKDLETMVDLICFQSFFSFQGKVYKQLRGVPMGSPMSGLLCELVVRRMERMTIFNYNEYIIMYKRYVDDVLIIWNNDAMIQRFLDQMNSNQHGLKLNLEQISSKQLHFLDVGIEFRNGTLYTKVYIKPTHDPMYIPANSNDPTVYKLSAFRALIRRAFLYCSNIMDTMDELGRIKMVAKELGFETRSIERLITAYVKPKSNSKKKPEAGGNFTKFTYNKCLFPIMKQISRHKNASILCKRAPTVYRLIRNDKERIGDREQAGVYAIPYKNEQLGIDKDYVGVTNRNLRVRIKEHQYDVAKNKCSTALSRIAQADGSVVQWEDAKILAKVHSPTLSSITEKCEIYRAGLSGRCLNYKDATGLPSSWKYMVKSNTHNNAYTEAQ